MKKLISRLLFSTLLLFFVGEAKAQCYIRLEDASGFNTAPYQDSLEAAAARLCAIFDSTGFQGQFKVYDFGFYLHHETETGGYPAPFAQKMQEVQDSSPYYLLFGKQTDKTGVYTKFWVDLKLPISGSLTCVTATSINLISERIKFEVEERYTQLGRSPFQYSEAITMGINELRAAIININNGVCCDPDPDIIYRVLIKMGFAGFACKILTNSTARSFGVLPKVSSGEVLDFAYLDIEEAGTPMALNNSLSQIILGLVNAGLNAKGFITKNENFCDSLKFEIVRTQYQASFSDYDVWFHLWKNPDNSGDDFLFVKSEKLDEIAYNFQAPPTEPWYPLTKSLIITHVTIKCPPTIEIHNFIGEEVFEETWHVFAERNFLPIYLYTRNFEIFAGGCRNTVPDGLATSYKPGSQFAFPNASWYESKATNCDVYLSSYENQILAHIQNLANAHPIACINNAAYFNIITTAGVNISSSVYRYAGGYKIRVINWEAWYKYNSNGKMEVTFGIRTTLNRIAPSLFPPDFQDYNGYQPVLLQNCD